MNISATLSLSDRLALILDGLYRAVAARIAGGALAGTLIILICGRVRRVEVRLQRLLARFRSGRVLVRVAPAMRRTGGTRQIGGTRLPRRFGWLLPLVPTHAAGFASQLRVVLDDAEMQALLAACPQARRVLAPLCRMLAIEPEALGLPPVVKPVRAVVTRVRTTPVVPAWRVPLPRGVLSAVRRQGFGKIR